MSNAQRWVLVGCVVAVAGATSLFMVMQIGVGRSEGEKTRAFAGAQIEAQSKALRKDVFDFLGATRADALGEVRHGVDTVVPAFTRAVTQATGSVDGAVAAANERLKVLDDVKPALANLTTITAAVSTDLVDGRRAVEASIHPEDIAGAVRDMRFLLARAARTAGHIEQASDTFTADLPKLIAGWNQIIDNSDKATAAAARASEATALTMGNFAKATKPLPTWLRIGLQIAPPVAQAGAAAAAAGVAFGWIKGR